MANKSNSRFVKVLLPSILSTLLCLIAIYDSAKAQQAIETAPTSKTSSQPPAPAIPKLISYGNQVSLNGRIFPGAWLQQKSHTGKLNTHISDGAIRQLVGVNLLNNNNPTRQPVQWFSSSTNPMVLTSLITTGYRYLDITNFAKTAEWEIQTNGNTLAISTPRAKAINIRQSQQTLGNTIIIDLDRPTPWQISQGLPVTKSPISLLDSDSTIPKPSSVPNREWTLTLDGIADTGLVAQYTTQEGDLARGQEEENILPPTLPTPSTPDSLIQKVEIVNNQTIIKLRVPFGLAPRVNTLSNPYRLTVEILPDAMVERSIAWAPGLRQGQQYVNLGQDRFPVVWLEINPRTTGVTLKPILTNSDTMVGTAPLIQTAQQQIAVAAINGGYFNRNNRLPLGAIRQDNVWLSGPILNRGAIAWNHSGEFYIGRLTLQETLIGTNNAQFPILNLNSGYVQSGIARYTPTWGATYTSLTDNEIILVVQSNKIINQFSGGKALENSIPIPKDGYLLTLRGNATASASQLPVGSVVKITSFTTPNEFNRYSHILGAGPVLLQNRQIVLDAKGEKFSDAFIAEKAVRSGICTTATGNLIIAAVHNRVGGAGPTLAEHAQLMQSLGCVNALNLDGGSSTSLYLGGQLLDRFPNTAARVHNGIGVFLPIR
ncbi:phosphodiester glycosidase family protein [Scytonema sp. NUACC21]